MGMTNTRYQVVEVRRGWAVRDMADGSICTHTYGSIGWATRRAIRLNEGAKYLTKSKPFIK